MTYYDPLRPNRSVGVVSEYEFVRGNKSVLIYMLPEMKFITEIEVGERPDCHSTTQDGKYLYIACGDGLHAIDISERRVIKHYDFGHVYGTNILPGGKIMFLHDHFGGILVVENIDDPMNLKIKQRLDIIGTNTAKETLGGKGDIRGNSYICCGWVNPCLYEISLSDYSFRRLTEFDERLASSDDLVLSPGLNTAYCACHSDNGTVVAVDMKSLQVKKIYPSGKGTCGLASLKDRRYVAASNDGEMSVTIIDTVTEEIYGVFSASPAFEKLGFNGRIQGITGTLEDEIFVYDCSGEGALVRFSVLGRCESNKSATVSCKTGCINITL